MHTTIFGAGAIGGVIGARLQQAGHAVTLVARGEHLRAMQTDGLRLAAPEGVETLRVDARDRVPDDTDLVWLAVKSQDTAEALGGVPAGCPVVSLQNGIGNERLIDAAGHPTVGAMVWLPAVHLEPGEVRLHCLAGEGRVDVGD